MAVNTQWLYWRDNRAYYARLEQQLQPDPEQLHLYEIYEQSHMKPKYSMTSFRRYVEWTGETIEALRIEAERDFVDWLKDTGIYIDFYTGENE